jgi:7-cyano-7-deazaguanine synthase
MSKALLLSGGIDSIAMAYWQHPDIAFTINYGQSPAATEIRVSKIICEKLHIAHHIIEIDCSTLGSGDLLNQAALRVSPSSEWWPYRNQLLVTIACMKGIALGIGELMLASVKSDGFHKDGTPEFYRLTDELMAYQEGAIRISCPAISMSSAELVQMAQVPRSLLNWAHSCHRSTVPCGNCRGCNKYREVMYELQEAGYE